MNTSIKYKDDLHVYKIVQAAWSTFKPAYTQANFIYIKIIDIIDIVPLDIFQTHV